MVWRGLILFGVASLVGSVALHRIGTAIDSGEVLAWIEAVVTVGTAGYALTAAWVYSGKVS